MAEDNEKKIAYLADVLEKYIKNNDIKVAIPSYRKLKQSNDCLGHEKPLFKLNN